MTKTGASLSCLRTKPIAFLALSQFFASLPHSMTCPASHRPSCHQRGPVARPAREI
ncbi:hypothetical protein BCEP27_110064 [Burkholderia cepacia]